jgi:hypothetical protein
VHASICIHCTAALLSARQQLRKDRAAADAPPPPLPPYLQLTAQAWQLLIRQRADMGAAHTAE